MTSWTDRCARAIWSHPFPKGVPMTEPPFWQPAQARAQIWRTLLGFAMIMALWFATTFATLAGAARILGRTVHSVASGADFAGAALFFLSFIGFHIGLALVLPLLHRRGYFALFGPARRMNLRHFLAGFAVTGGVALVLYALMGLEHLVLPEGVPPGVEQARPLGTWLAGLAPALGLIFLQTFAEEAVFRGYLLQQLRARFRSVLIWGVAPALVFGLLHFDPGTYGYGNAAAYVLNATVMGTLAALVTLRTGTLGAAAGLHFGNNAALVLVGIRGNFEGFSLFTVEMDLSGPYTTYSILNQTAAMVVVFGLWWRWMARHRPIAKAARRG